MVRFIYLLPIGYEEDLKTGLLILLHSSEGKSQSSVGSAAYSPPSGRKSIMIEVCGRENHATNDNQVVHW